MKKQETGTEVKNCLVYLHMKANTSKIFYVGISTNFRRPFDERNRSKAWKAVAEKYGVEVEIIAENLTWKEACIEEKKLILKFGRRDLGKGFLVNLTEGGDGAVGRKDTEQRRREKKLLMLEHNPMKNLESRKKVSLSKLGKSRPDMKGTNNIMFYPGVKEKKTISRNYFLYETEAGKKYLENVRERYTRTLGRPEIKKKRLESYRAYLASLSKEEKIKKTEKMNSKKFSCKYCKILTNKGNYTRWHGEKCKQKKNINESK